MNNLSLIHPGRKIILSFINVVVIKQSHNKGLLSLCLGVNRKYQYPKVSLEYISSLLNFLLLLLKRTLMQKKKKLHRFNVSISDDYNEGWKHLSRGGNSIVNTFFQQYLHEYSTQFGSKDKGLCITADF